MHDILSFLGRLFTERPYLLLAWPASAMIAGWLAMAFSSGTAAQLAITPRTAKGLVGILVAPFLHANFAHLAANLPPFLVLGWLVLRRGESAFVETALIIAAAQGLLLWLCGRKAAHVGMSGVIFGFFAWLLGVAWFTHTTPDLLAAAGVIVFYGGMLAGVVPARAAVSWEGHFFGLIAGAALAWFRYRA